MVAADTKGLGWMTQDRPFSLSFLCPRVATGFPFHKFPPVKRRRKTKGSRDQCVF